MKNTRIFQTGSFLLAASYAALFILSTGLLFSIVFWLASNLLLEQAGSLIEEEMKELEITVGSKKTDALMVEINRRIANKPSFDFYYGLYDPIGKLLAGNLSQGPVEIGWQKIMLHSPKIDSGQGDSSDKSGIELFALAHPSGEGWILCVAFDTFRISKAQEAITRSFAWAAVVGVVLALLGGMLLSRGYLKRIDAFNHAVTHIIAGHMGERLDLRGTHDELDQLGRNFNTMLDRLQESMEGLKQVSNDIAHDLRTPLSRLKRFLESAQLEAVTPDDYNQAIQGAMEQADSALNIFSALLRIAQIESGSRRGHFDRVDLSALLLELTIIYSPVAEDMGKSLTSDILPDIQLPHGDRELLMLMFVNLIENALRHTPEGIEVGVRLVHDGGEPVAEVMDQGPGIPEGEWEKIFHRFHRLDASRSTPGNGLGLALVKAVAELHEAQLHVRDNHPGAVFSIRFLVNSGYNPVLRLG